MPLSISRIACVIPCLDPDEHLPEVVSGLLSSEFGTVILVDDGSSPETQHHFYDSLPLGNVVLLRHEINLGKGAGIRTAVRYLFEHPGETDGMITVDCDGQHLASDAVKCARALCETGNPILGVRDFSGKDVPPRSRFGNRMTCLTFRVLCGLKISDTQTGLRAFPSSAYPFLLSLQGNRYEYETNMLLEAKRNGLSFHEVPIETVYLDNNRASHFRPLRDSLRIYRVFLRFILSSLSSALFDYLVFFLIHTLLEKIVPGLSGWWTIAVSTAAARLCSSVLNFCLNRNLVFRNKNGVCKTLLRYYALAIPQMSVSAFLVYLLSLAFGAKSGILRTLIKVIVDVVLFIVSFRVQREWVFRPESNAKGGA